MFSPEKRVLFLAPTTRDATLTAGVLERAGIGCAISHHFQELCQMLHVGAGAIMLAEEAMQMVQLRSLTQWLHRQPPWSDLPVLVLCRNGADSPAVAQAVELLGNVTVLERPIRIAAFVTSARSALRARQRQYQMREHLEERARQEQKLREQAALLNAVNDNTTELIFMKDLNGSLTYCNAATLKMLGVTQEEALSKRQPELVPVPEQRANITANDRQVAEGGESIVAEEPFSCADGQMRVFHSTKTPYRDDDGHIIGVIGVSIDITERKRTEQLLRQSEERFRMLADNMAQLAWTCDSFGYVTWYNQRWLDYTGYTLEEVAGWGWEKAMHPSHVERITASIKEFAAQGKPWSDTFQLRDKDGNYRWFLSQAVPIRDDSGEIVRWFGTNTDITEQRELENALREADRRKDEFLATLAHELRNPLAPIRNSLHVLRQKSIASPTTIQVGEMMERQVNHMVRLVDDLMEVSRISRGKIELQCETVELATIIQSAVETARPHIDAARHQLFLEMPEEPIKLHADPVRLAQVFANLLNNAAKYTEPGGRIWLRAHRDDCCVCVSIRDSGVGIAPTMLDRVFDLFAQVDESARKSQGGLGIGLSLVKSLVELHHGSVMARSDGLGLGSEFLVQLPILAERQSEAMSAAGESVIQAAPCRVLVVDDNRDAAESLGMLLELLGVETHVVYSGPEALLACETFQPEVIFLDIGMPKMDGLAVAREIRKRSDGEQITLVALTGWSQEQDRERTKNAGFNHHLTKPADIATLSKLLPTMTAK
jgi:PAS domain S-box-containing protein